jgi:Leucine-rich repeat (LRR) protein
VWLDPICVDLGPLARLPNLRGLWFGPTMETNITQLPHVTTLGYVAATPASTAALLRSLPSLTAIGGGLPGANDSVSERGSLDFSTADERAALAELTNLTQLELTNQSDISFVAGLTQLATLAVGNGVQDISALSGLVGLVHVVLDNNPISDLAPLVANPGLGIGDDVSILNANLNCAQQQKNIAALRSRGVTLKTNCP